MTISKKQHEAFARFFEKPTREGLRDLLKGNIGETNYLDFKETWPEGPKLAKHILALANSGGGAIIAGVAELPDKTIEPKGLSKLTDKADLEKSFRKFIPNELGFVVLDFSYQESEYPSLKGKHFQVILVEESWEYLPFLSMSDGDGIKKSAVYVRAGTNSTEATHEQLQKIINKRIETGYSSQKILNLRDHLEQLKVLEGEKNRERSSLFNPYRRGIGNFPGNRGSMHEKLISSDYELFITSLYDRKKKLIERDLGL